MWPTATMWSTAHLPINGSWLLLSLVTVEKRCYDLTTTILT